MKGRLTSIHRLPAKLGLIILGLITSLASSCVWAESSVWRISKDGYQLYLGGTVHILTTEDYPLPTEFEKAYGESTKLVFETDMQKLQSTETQQRLLTRMAYQHGESIETRLAPETIAKLEDFLADRGVPLARVSPLRVGWLTVTLSMLELDRLGLVGEGVDQYFQNRGLADHKAIGKLEAVTEQIDFLSEMGEGHEDEMILETLQELQSLEQMMHDLKTAWREGDMPWLTTVGLQDLRRFPTVYEALLVDRNNHWLPRIQAMLEDAQVEFVLVGALHLAGKDGLLALLKARGYTVEQI